ncbi:MAG: response regulator [Rhodoferax sp.]
MGRSIADPGGRAGPVLPPAILLVEDDAALREYLADVLRGEGWVVQAAHDRRSALAGLHAQAAIGVVVLDMGLPPQPSTLLEGVQTLRALLRERPALKVLVLTGQDETGAARAAVQEGAFDFLTKPAPMEQVLQAVRRAVLFYSNEADLAQQGHARLSVTARLGEGPREAGAQAEEQLVRRIFTEARYNVAETARRLGLAREHVYYYLNKYGIKRPE